MPALEYATIVNVKQGWKLTCVVCEQNLLSPDDCINKCKLQTPFYSKIFVI